MSTVVRASALSERTFVARRTLTPCRIRHAVQSECPNRMCHAAQTRAPCVKASMQCLLYTTYDS